MISSLPIFGRPLDDFGQSVRRLQCRNDAFKAGERLEGFECLMVHDRHVFDAADVVQLGMLGADAGIVETGGNRVALLDLAVAVLQQVGAVAMQDTRRTCRDRGAVLVAIEALAAGFDADDLDARVIEERMENADRV